MILWLIGLSGSGKTTLCEEILKSVKSSGRLIVKIDGDEIREMFDNDLSYSIDDRLKNANRISKLCKFLDDQGIDVICAILSFREETRRWNRENIKNYYEVFIDAPIKDCVDRDVKGMYNKFYSGKIKNVVGFDINFEKPNCPDLTINNSGTIDSLLNFKSQLSSLFYENKQ